MLRSLRNKIIGFGLIFAVAGCSSRSLINPGQVRLYQQHHRGQVGTNIPDGLGVNIHWTDPRPGEMRMLAATGLHWIRMDFFWNATETVRGKYNFTAYHNLVKMAQHYHMQVFFVLDYGNPLYQHGKFPTTSTARHAFSAWAAAAVDSFRGNGVVWEMWSEPDGGSGNGGIPIDPQAYAKLAVETGQAIYRTDRHAYFIGPGVAWMQRPWKGGQTWIQWLFKGGVLNVFDAVSVHPYRKRPPETVMADYCRFQRVVADYAPSGSSLQLVSSEWGYPSAPRWFFGSGYSRSAQARLLAREFLINLMCHIPISIWYDWHDDGPATGDIRFTERGGIVDAKTPDPEFHFGLVGFTYHAHRHYVYTPKPAFFACRTLTQTLRGFHFDKRIKEHNPSVFVLVFARGKQRRWVAWSVVSPPSGRATVTLRVPRGNYRIINYLGDRQIRTRVGATGLKLRLSTGPQYVSLLLGN